MATKTGGGGRPQKYDRSGKYSGGGCLLFFVATLIILLASRL